MGLRSAVGDGPVGLDTCVFIYFIEEHHRYLPVVEPLFEAIDQGGLQGATSALTLLETLVLPLRAGDRSLAWQYEALLTRSRGLQLVGLTLPVLREAAALRAVARIKTPDALQLAAARTTGCTTFVTNDRGLCRVPGLRVLELKAFL